MTEHQRRALVRAMSDEVARCADRDQLVVYARRWLYEYRPLNVYDRALRALIAAALARFEAETAAATQGSAPRDPGAMVPNDRPAARQRPDPPRLAVGAARQAFDSSN
jgi:hypothetical protein